MESLLNNIKDQSIKSIKSLEELLKIIPELKYSDFVSIIIVELAKYNLFLLKEFVDWVETHKDHYLVQYMESLPPLCMGSSGFDDRYKWCINNNCLEELKLIQRLPTMGKISDFEHPIIGHNWDFYPGQIRYFPNSELEKECKYDREDKRIIDYGEYCAYAPSKYYEINNPLVWYDYSYRFQIKSVEMLQYFCECFPGYDLNIWLDKTEYLTNEILEYIKGRIQLDESMVYEKLFLIPDSRPDIDISICQGDSDKTFRIVKNCIASNNVYAIKQLLPIIKNMTFKKYDMMDDTVYGYCRCDKCISNGCASQNDTPPIKTCNFLDYVLDDTKNSLFELFRLVFDFYTQKYINDYGMEFYRFYDKINKLIPYINKTENFMFIYGKYKDIITVETAGIILYEAAYKNNLDIFKTVFTALSKLPNISLSVLERAIYEARRCNRRDIMDYLQSNGLNFDRSNPIVDMLNALIYE